MTNSIKLHFLIFIQSTLVRTWGVPGNTGNAEWIHYVRGNTSTGTRVQMRTAGREVRHGDPIGVTEVTLSCMVAPLQEDWHVALRVDCIGMKFKAACRRQLCRTAGQKVTVLSSPTSLATSVYVRPLPFRAPFLNANRGRTWWKSPKMWSMLQLLRTPRHTEVKSWNR